MHATAMRIIETPTHTTAMEMIRPWKVLMVDDDTIFCRILAREAAGLGIEIDSRSDAKALGEVTDMSEYDMVLMDQHLGFSKGTRLSRFFNTFFANVPIVMISASSEWWHATGAEWPENVRRFIHKDRPMREMANEIKEALKEIIRTGHGTHDHDAAPEYLNSRIEYIPPTNPWTARKAIGSRMMGGVGQALLRVRALF